MQQTNTYLLSAYSVPSSGPSALGTSQVASCVLCNVWFPDHQQQNQLRTHWKHKSSALPWTQGISTSGSGPCIRASQQLCSDSRARSCLRTTGIRASPESRKSFNSAHHNTAPEFTALSVSLSVQTLIGCCLWKQTQGTLHSILFLSPPPSEAFVRTWTFITTTKPAQKLMSIRSISAKIQCHRKTHFCSSNRL